MRHRVPGIARMTSAIDELSEEEKKFWSWDQPLQGRPKKLSQFGAILEVKSLSLFLSIMPPLKREDFRWISQRKWSSVSQGCLKFHLRSRFSWRTLLHMVLHVPCITCTAGSMKRNFITCDTTVLWCPAASYIDQRCDKRQFISNHGLLPNYKYLR